jgi:hypothetical protein
MNPDDYYKTYHDKLYKHEMKRMDEMQDKQLYTRYDKMSKPDKIGAFYEALADKDRCPSLRKRIEKDGCVPAKQDCLMKFVKVLDNSDDNTGNENKKALFSYDDNYYLYSFVQNNLRDGACTINETMTFLANSEGEIVDASELFNRNGYIHSTDAMNSTVQAIDNRNNISE